MSATAPQKTPLHALHLELGAKMVEFAGYDMPVSYPAGIMAEHRHCRSQRRSSTSRTWDSCGCSATAPRVPSSTWFRWTSPAWRSGRQRYALFTNSSGGILDDLMVTRREDDLFVVVNAACKDADVRHLVTHIGDRCTVRTMPDQALLALQGPQRRRSSGARSLLASRTLTFMSGRSFVLAGADCYVTRSGYTGEDGFEISVPAEAAEALARLLLMHPQVEPAGLGARDTLRLEAGLCLYGHDIDATTTPIEAGLSWAIQKVRRAGGAREGGYPGAPVIDAQLAMGAPDKRSAWSASSACRCARAR